MKKLLLVLSLLFIFTGCEFSKKSTIDNNERYFNLINIIKENDNFIEKSNYYDVKTEVATINNGYRYYITIDNAHAAMYNVEAIAIELDKDYSKQMTANVGIFDDLEYCMIPNQSNSDKGYVEGIVISGTTENQETTLYLLVQWYNVDYSQQYREFFKLDAKYEALYE